MRGFLAPEDVIQDTFDLVFRGIDSFDRSLPGGFSSWLLTIADNRLAETVRSFRALKRGGGVRALSAELGIRSGTAEDLLGVLAQIRRTPSQSAARIEAARCLCDALANISNDYREALTLRYFEGLSVAETAARMNRTERSVHMLCHRALRCLGDILGSSSAYLSR
jgi:RNA polymerase sigma-70 factor (ECF subfamily)